MKKIPIKRGDIFWVNFDLSKATEIQKTRPALVCSHDILNENSFRIIVAPITSNLKKVYSFEYAIKNSDHLKGKIMLDQMKSIDKSRLGKKMETLLFKEMQEIDAIIKFVLGVQ
jgi:mRNA interferase MazF